MILRGDEALDLEPLLEAERYTLVEFAAAWCQTCRQVESWLDPAVRRHPNLHLLRVDVHSWTSPVVERHRVRSLPDLRLHFGTALVTRDEAAIWRFLGVRFEEP